MRTLIRPTVLLVLIAILVPAGCSSTAGLRTGAAPKIRTIASVGDKALPAEAGAAGSSVAADEYTPERRVNPEGRVSGRVFDERGEPVASARVRLALGGAAGGKVVTTKTDRSGAFTLQGLRPGTNYTVIAEWKDQELGTLSGRAEAQAPEADVRITVLPDEQTFPPARAAGSVNRVSRPQADDSAEEPTDEAAPGGSKPRPRTELLPPAPEAEAFSSSTERRARRSSRADDTEPPMTARWHRGDADRPAAGAVNRSAPDDELYDDDGHNPLPPALAPEAPGSGERTSLHTGDRKAGARGGRVIAPESFTPITLAEKPLRPDDPFNAAVAPAAPSSGSQAAQAPPVVPWYDARSDDAPKEAPRVAHEESSLVTPVEPEPAPAPPRRVKWGELAGGSPPPDREPVRERSPVSAEGRPRLVASTESPAPPPAPASDDGIVAYCRFDAKSRRIVDFRLPDSNGKPMRFQDFDSDLILLDFWGTWCKPCVGAIPHLVELQNRLGGKRLTVVGIASEQGAPVARLNAVTKAIQKYGINYPVLLSGMDGENCPVQEALHIQAFPTLILVDRQGRILWRDQGATPATLARLDHFIAAATKSDDTRRY